jgi:transposase
MRTVDDFAALRRAHRDGLSIRQIAKQFGVGRDTVRKALAQPEPKPYALAKPRPAPTFGAFHATVDTILDADENAPRKQRHTASQLFRRLREEFGYTGGYDQVRRYVQARRRDRRETFIPLDHPPGHRAEADFGHIAADFPDGRRPVPVLLVTWSYSNCPFALALPTERTEAILHGLVEAFAFFGCVPRELWWDNPTTVAITVLRGRERHLQPRYAALASHYTFAPQLCMPAKATEKPRVEHRVFDLQRRWATPVPRVAGLDALNAHLRRCCVAEQDQVSGEYTETVGVRFARDRVAALPVAAPRFDACVLQPGQVDKYQTVRFDHNSYSVPRRWAFQAVTVKGYVERVEVVADGQVVARHARCYDRGQRVLDPLHYLVTLERKPAALDHAPVYRDWQLPATFTELRHALEKRLGVRTGARQFIRVLQLLARHPLARVERAIVCCQQRGDADATAITDQAERLAQAEALTSDNGLSLNDNGLSLSDNGMSLSDNGLSSRSDSLTTFQVPAPDLTLFNRLLSPHSQGDRANDPTNHLAAEGQSEAVEVADHAGGVRETRP